MSFLDRMFGKVSADRKGSRGNHRSPSGKQNRRLAMEHMESRVMMSANPICNAVVHNLDIVAVPALVAENLPGSLPAAPLATTKLTATAYSASQINLTWTSVAGVTDYLVEEWTGSGWKGVVYTGSGTTSWAVTGLSANTTCRFQVVAWSAAAGGTLSNQVCATTGIMVDHPTTVTPYTNVSGTLFGPSGQPSYLDVQQGMIGDCWLMASLAEVAVRDPQAIVSMFTADGTTVENGVAVSLYKVRFFDNGVPKTVVVDTELPAATAIDSSKGATGNYAQTPKGVLWVALAEKAYAQANGAGFVTTFDPGQDSYAALNNGLPAGALQAITGDSPSDFDTTNTNIAAAWSQSEFVVLCTGSAPASAEIVPQHDYALVDCGSSAGTSADNQPAKAQMLPTSRLPYTPTTSMPFLVYNPWGTTPSGVANLVETSGQRVYGLFTANSNFMSTNFPQIATYIVSGGDAPAETRTHLAAEAAMDLVLAGWGI